MLLGAVVVLAAPRQRPLPDGRRPPDDRARSQPEYLPASESKDDAIISPIELSCLCPDPETNLCGCSAGSECCEVGRLSLDFFMLMLSRPAIRRTASLT